MDEQLRAVAEWLYAIGYPVDVNWTGHPLPLVMREPLIAVALADPAHAYGDTREEVLWLIHAETGENWADPSPAVARGERDRLLNRTPQDTYRCQRCGVRDGMDASLPNSQWAAIAGDEWRLLCLWCIDALATEKGVQYEAHLYFNGVSGRSALYDSDKDHRWTELLEEARGERDALAAENAALREALDRAPDLKLPPHHTQVDPEWARAILEAHQPKAAANHCDVCFVRWPCEIADLAATVLALWEAAESPPSLTG